MVGTIPPRVASRENKSATDVTAVQENNGDGPWVQPATENLIKSPGVTVDPNVLENMLQSRKSLPTVLTRTEKSPNASATAAGRRGSKPPSRTVKVRASAPIGKTTPPPTVKTTTNGATGTTPSPNKKTETDVVVNGDIDKVSKGIINPNLATNGHSEEALLQKEVEKRAVVRDEEVFVRDEVAMRSGEPNPRYGQDGAPAVSERRDTAVLGRDLYMRFLHEEMRTVHVREPPNMDPWREARLDLGYSQSLTASVRIRKSLRLVADAFAASEQREKVRQRAARVDIQTLDCASFHDLLASLFQEGKVTSERVVVLFYFCADLTIRALSEQLTHCFHHLVDWTQVYIVDTFSVWVQQNGGWSAILDDSASMALTAAKVGAACIAVVALVALIRRAR